MPAPRTISSVRATPTSRKPCPYIWIATAESAIKHLYSRRPELPQMNLISALAAALTLCGRHGTLIAAASIFIGLAVPPLAAAFRPHLGEATVAMLTLAFLRVDPVELRRHWTQPGLIAAAMVWAMLILPVVLGMVFLAFKLDQKMPGLYFMLVLQMSALGLMSSPALAALLGLDVALT